MALTEEFLNFLTEEEKRKAGVSSPNPQQSQEKDVVEGLPEYTPPAQPTEPSKEKDNSIANNMHEFVGQMVWGALDSAAWGTLELGETLSESTGLTEENAVEKYLALGAEGNWDDLTGMGKAGYVVGSGLGMLPTFGWASKAVSATSRGIGLGAKALTKENEKQIGKFLVDEVANNTLAKSITGSTGKINKLGSQVVSDIVAEGNKLKQVSNGFINPMKSGYTTLSEEAIQMGARRMGNDVAEEITVNHLQKSIAGVLDSAAGGAIKVSPDELEQITQAVFKVVKTENPTNVRHAIRSLLSDSLPDKAQDLISAYAMDAVLVGLHGGMTAVAHNITKFGAEHAIDAKVEYDGAGKMASDMLHHGAWGGFIGVARFIPGGKGSKILADDIGGIIKRSTTSFEKMLSYTIPQKREAVKLLYKASKGESGVLTKMGVTNPKFDLSSIKSMPEAELDAILTASMKNIPSELNSLVASGAWKDMYQSLPRMLAGSAAMNLPNIWELGKSGGSLSDASSILGTEPEEIMANLFVGMMFSKRGEKFRNKSKYWEQMSESNRHFAETADEIKKLQEASNYLSYSDKVLELHHQAFKGSDISLAGDQAKQQIIKDPDLKSAYDTIEAANAPRKTMGERLDRLGDGAKTFKQYIVDKIVEIKADPALSEADRRVALREVKTAQGMFEAILAHKRAYSVEKVNEVAMEKGDFDLMLEGLKNQSVGNQRADTPRQLSQMLTDRANKVFQEQTLGTTNIKMEFLHKLFEKLDIPSDYNPETGKIEIPQNVLDLGTRIFDFGSKGGDPMMTDSIVRLINRASEAGLLSGSTETKMDIKMPSSKVTGEIRKELFDDANHRVLSEIHGVNYRDQGIHAANMDMAMASDAGWASYHAYRENNQAHRIQYVVTGKGDPSGVNVADAKHVRELFSRLANKDITWEPGNMDTAEVTELQVFAKNLNQYLKYYNPPVSKPEKVDLNMGELKNLRDKLIPMIGDVFSNPKSFSKAVTLSIENFTKDLGGHGLHNRHDVKRGLLELVSSGDFGSWDKATGKIVLPDLPSVLEHLNVLYSNKPNGVDMTEHYMGFYRELVGELQSSTERGIISLERSTQHDNAVDWTIAIEKAMRASDTYRYEIIDSGDLSNAVGDSMSLSKRFIEIKMADPATEPALLEMLTSHLKQTNALEYKYKTAMAEGDRTVLHALAKEVHRLDKIIDDVQTNREIDGPISEMHAKILDSIVKKMTFAKDIKEYDKHFEDMVGQNNVDRAAAKSMGDKPRVSLQEFIVKFGLDQSIVKRLGKAAAMYYDPTSPNNSQYLIGIDRVFFDANGYKSLNQPQFDINNATPQDFIKPWAERLMDRMILRNQSDPTIKIPTMDEIVVDLQQGFVDHLLNSRVVKEITYNSQNGKAGVGTVGEQRLSNWTDHGVTGVLDAFNLWDGAYILKDTGKIDGKPVFGFGTKEMARIDSDLQQFVLNVENIQGHLGEAGEINTKGTTPKKYIRIAMDEGTNLIIRFDKEAKDRIRGAFSEGAPMKNVLDRMVANTDGHTRFNKMINSKETLTDSQAKEIILHARLMKAFPHKLKEMYLDKNLWGDGVSYEGTQNADLWKRLKMSSSKSGIIPNPVMVKSSIDILKSMNSPLFKAVLDRASNVIKPDGTGSVKILTIDESANGVDANGKPLPNKYNIYDRYVAAMRERFYEGYDVDGNKIKGGIPEHMLEKQIAELEGKFKEMTDAVTYVTLDPMVAFASIMGPRQEHFTFDGDGNINGLKYGLKPVIAHSYVGPNGSHEVYYNKTAFHYDPVMAGIMKDLGVDMLAFKSGNKVNNFSPDSGPGTDRYMRDMDSSPNRLLNPLAHDGMKQLVDKDGASFSPHNPNHVAEIPLSSIMLKNMALNHLPTLSQSMGVHTNHDNGIFEWGQLNSRFQAARKSFSNLYTDPYRSTKIARQVTDVLTRDGDMSGINSGLDIFLKDGGTGDTPWIRRQIEQKMISYYLNGGSIATAEAGRGNMNIMIPERGNFAQPLKHDGRQYIFGESMPSHVEGAQELSFFGHSDGTHQNVGSFIIKRSERVGWEMKNDVPVTHGEEIPIHAEYVIYKDGNTAKVSVEGFELLLSGELVSNNGKTTPRDLNTDALKKARKIHREELVSEMDKLEALKGEGPLTYADAMEAIAREDIFGITNADISKRSSEGYEFTLGKPVGLNQKYNYAGGQELYIAHNNITGRYEVLRRNGDGDFIKETDAFGLELALRNIREGYATGKSNRWLGATDLRMPSNGTDNVVTKSRGQFHIDPKTGEIYFEGALSENMGPMKMMNMTDADRVQDADFDWDKSASYTAVHGKFLKNVLSVAGHDQVSDQITLDAIKEMVKTEQQNIDLTNPNDAARVKDMLADVNKFRGRIVKAHQIVTYLVNAFGEYGGRGADLYKNGDGRTVVGEVNIGTGGMIGEVILRNPMEITTNKAFVRTLVKKFLDYYKNPPKGLENYDTGQDIIKEIYFGKDGLFTLRAKRGSEQSEAEAFMNGKNYPAVKDAIVREMIQPLSKYIGFNKGEVMSSEGSMQATLADFALGRSNLMWSLTNSFHKSDFRLQMEGDFRITNGKEALWKYINSTSETPFDRGMAELSSIHNARAGNRSGPNDIVSTLINSAANSGFEATKIDAYMNKNLNKIYAHYVNNQAKVVELGELGAAIKGLDRTRRELEQYNQKTYKVMPEHIAIVEKLDALKRAEADLNALVSTFDKENTFKIKIAGKREDGSQITYPEGKYINNFKTPIVVYTKTGKGREISEVIHPTQSNKKYIGANEIAVLNGRRFQHVDGGEYRDAKAAFNVFGGVLKYRDGSTMPITEKLYIDGKVKSLIHKVMENDQRYDKFEMDEAKFAEKSIEKEALLNHALKELDGPSQRKAFIFSLLTPGVDREVIAITSSSNLPGSNTTFDYAFKPNFWEQPVYKYLAAKATGSRFSDTANEHAFPKAESREIMKSITEMKTVEKMRLYDPTYHINNLSHDMSTSRASDVDLDVISGKLNETFLTKINAESMHKSEILNNFLDWMTGKRVMTPSQLDRLTNKFIEKGFNPQEMYLNQRFSVDKNNKSTPYGDAHFGQTIVGTQKFSGTGRFGQPGSHLVQEPLSYVKEKIKQRCKPTF